VRRAARLGLVLLLLAGSCRGVEERQREEARAQQDSLLERTRRRPPPPDTGWDYRLPARDTARPRP
jgi:hypothetical protein